MALAGKAKPSDPRRGVHTATVPVDEAMMGVLPAIDSDGGDGVLTGRSWPWPGRRPTPRILSSIWVQLPAGTFKSNGDEAGRGADRSRAPLDIARVGRGKHRQVGPKKRQSPHGHGTGRAAGDPLTVTVD